MPESYNQEEIQIRTPIDMQLRLNLLKEVGWVKTPSPRNFCLSIMTQIKMIQECIDVLITNCSYKIDNFFLWIYDNICYK
jgi:hypothetical protein